GGDENAGGGLSVEGEGDLALRVEGGTFRTAAPVRAFAWTFVRAELADGVVRLEQRPLVRLPFDASAASAEHAFDGAATSAAPLVLGGHGVAGAPLGCLHGKLEGPRAGAGGETVAHGDFSRDIAR